MGSRSPLPVSTSAVVSPVLTQRAPRRGLFSPAIKPSEPENTLLKMVLAKLPHSPGDWLTFSWASQCEKSMLRFELPNESQFIIMDPKVWMKSIHFCVEGIKYSKSVINYSTITWNPTIKRQVGHPNSLSQSDRDYCVKPWLLLLYINQHSYWKCLPHSWMPVYVGRKSNVCKR